MTESNQAEESIEHSIRKNGFPQKLFDSPLKRFMMPVKIMEQICPMFWIIYKKGKYLEKLLATMLNFALGKRSILCHLTLLRRMNFPG